MLPLVSIEVAYTIIPMSQTETTYIDAKGLNCPMPLMLLKQTMRDLTAGKAVIIDVTDEHAELDFEIWCERFGHQLQCVVLEPSVWRFQITKA